MADDLGRGWWAIAYSAMRRNKTDDGWEVHGRLIFREAHSSAEAEGLGYRDAGAAYPDSQIHWLLVAPHPAAQAIDARSGETEGLDPKGESAVGNADAPMIPGTSGGTA